MVDVTLDDCLADWVRRAGKSDRPAAHQLLVSLRPTLVRVVASVLGSSHPEFDDALQQSSLALIRAAAVFRGECHPAGYAARIALRVALRTRRKTRREWGRRDHIDYPLFEGDASMSPNDLAEANERRELLRDLVATLPTTQSEALILRAVLGWSLDEVARATGVPCNTVRSRIRLARQALRRSIERAPYLVEALDA
jgi:RNA polymerase sigma factor (sigma-70 family)